MPHIRQVACHCLLVLCEPRSHDSPALFSHVKAERQCLLTVTLSPWSLQQWYHRSRMENDQKTLVELKYHCYLGGQSAFHICHQSSMAPDFTFPHQNMPRAICSTFSRTWRPFFVPRTICLASAPPWRLRLSSIWRLHLTTVRRRCRRSGGGCAVCTSIRR